MPAVGRIVGLLPYLFLQLLPIYLLILIEINFVGRLLKTCFALDLEALRLRRFTSRRQDR